MNTNIKPFYIYTNKNSLYIKNINKSAEKLANNIYTYSANIDVYGNIHILAIDSIGRFIHFSKNNNVWRKKTLHKHFNNTKNIKDIRLYILNNYFNVFAIEKYPLDDNLFKISHINFNMLNYNVFKHTIDKVVKTNSSIYKLDIDELSNITLKYKTKDILSRNSYDNIIIFNSISRKWVTSTPIFKINQVSLNEKNTSSNIKSDIFEYCYSIKYKL